MDTQAKGGRAATKDVLNPRTTSYEFFGPPGAALVTIGTPAITYLLYLACNEQQCSISRIPAWPPAAAWVTARAINFYFLWFFGQVLLWKILPGAWVQGAQLRDGTVLSYKMNGLASLFVIGGIVAAVLYQDIRALEWMVTDTLPLITVSCAASVALALYSYIDSYSEGALLAEGGNSGNVVYDYFIGRCLNPRIGDFDIKCFCELRPGLSLWLLMDVVYAVHQYSALGRVTDSMVLVLFFQAWYIVDSVVNEEKVLSTMDITTDGFGFMLSFGDLCWVPFTYSIQARYLSTRAIDLGYLAPAVLGLQLFGFYIFRSANSQKDRFRADPNAPAMRGMKHIATKRGTKLLCDGWWGRARHVNYLGDWLMSCAWSMTTLFATPLTYFYPAYFAVLLIHRERRDDEKCHRRYGKDWEAYRKAVPSRIIPGIY